MKILWDAKIYSGFSVFIYRLYVHNAENSERIDKINKNRSTFVAKIVLALFLFTLSILFNLIK